MGLFAKDDSLIRMMTEAVTSITEVSDALHDREDMYRLLEHLDDVADSVEHACQLLVAYELGALPEAFTQQTTDIESMGEVSAAALGRLQTPQSLVAAWREVSAFETAIDARHRAISAELLNDTTRDLREALKVKEVSDNIEIVADDIVTFIRTLVMMAVKETQWTG